MCTQPVVPFSVREARRDVVVPREICKPPHDGNYVIRKGDRCVIHQFTVSKLDSFYDDPMKYDPTRFLGKGVRTFSQSVYPFFNQNPRLCLGRDFALMEAKMFLYHFCMSIASLFVGVCHFGTLWMHCHFDINQ